MKKFIIIVLTNLFVYTSYAGQQSTSFSINGNVSATCTTVSATNVTLPGSLSSIQTGTTTLTVNCSQLLPYTISVSSLNNWNLKYASGSDVVGYGLAYTGTNPSVNTTWSSTPGTSGTTTVTSASINGTGANQTYPLRVTSIAPSSVVSTGSYSDVVTVNINF